MMTEYFQTGLKKGRGLAQQSRDLIEAMHDFAKAAQPITGRGIGYKLFVAQLIDAMSRENMGKVYRLLVIAREQKIIPWRWIVDETRGIERVAVWRDPEEYAACVADAYRRDFWVQQPHRVQVWSEKGTVRGVLRPVLDHYGVGFNPVHGFNSVTNIHDIAEDDDGRPLIVLYVGDYDPSGMCMSERDLPNRFAKYHADHIKLKRIALTAAQTKRLASFPAADKQKDTRYRWFVSNYGPRCWELDAMDPNNLRNLVEREIVKLIEPVAWQRCEVVNAAERDSLQTILEGWGHRTK